MYAVIKSGGKQYRVEKGQTLDVERLDGDKVDLSPVLVVDGDKVLATPDELRGAKVSARVVGDAKGPKITGFTYKGSTHGRRRWGHRQKYSTIEITSITEGSKSSSTKASTTETSKATKSTSKSSTATKSSTAAKATKASSKATASKASEPKAAKATKAAKKTTKPSEGSEE